MEEEEDEEGEGESLDSDLGVREAGTLGEEAFEVQEPASGDIR